MSGQQPGPAVCLSYLAAASLWTVSSFPAPNQGAEILGVEQSIAADGPMVAAVLRALGIESLLLANNFGEDLPGSNVLQWLQRHQVATTAQIDNRQHTPQIVVVADSVGTRTWFPHLPGVVENLEQLDLSPLASASFAYIDCYELIRTPAVRAVRRTRGAGVPLLLNLGGSSLSGNVVEAIRGYPELIIQTNVDDDNFAEADSIGSRILDATEAKWVIVTAGSQGALALSREESLRIAAFETEVRHTHCAGAAFSGGLLYGLLRGLAMADSLTLASASGAMRCERAHDQPMPTLKVIEEVIRTRERVPVIPTHSPDGFASSHISLRC